MVSDPLPLPGPSFDWESWCSEAFTLPPLATANLPVPGALDFELFNFGAFSASQSAGQSQIRSPPPATTYYLYHISLVHRQVPVQNFLNKVHA